MTKITPGDQDGPRILGGDAGPSSQPPDGPSSGSVGDGPMQSLADAPFASLPPDAAGAAGSPDAALRQTGPDAAVASSCSPDPTRFAPRFGLAATDGIFLYGWGAQSIVRVGEGGGTPEIIVGDIDTSHDGGLLVDETSIFWFVGNDSGADIFSAPKSGGAVTRVGSAPGLDVYGGLAMDAHRLYYLTSNDVMALSKAGGSSVTIAGFEGTYIAPIAIGAVDDGFVYWAVRDASRDLAEVDRAPKTGGAPTTLTSLEGDGAGWGPANFAVVEDATNLYVYSIVNVYRIAKADGATTTIYDVDTTPLPFGGDNLMGLALSHGWVYWWSMPREPSVSADPRVVLQAVRTDGSAPRLLVNGSWPLLRVGGLVALGDSLYFSSADPPEVDRICSGG